MKWTFRIQHKFKTALLFLVVVVMVLGCSFLESRYLKQMNNSVSSIYKDRLIPEAELFHINDNMHSRRLILEKYLISPASYQQGDIRQQLGRHKFSIDSLINNFETTFLVAEEDKMLTKLKATLQQYNHLEASYLAATDQKMASAAYQNELEPVFSQIHSELLVLSKIQTQIGKELFHGSEVMQGSAISVSYLQIAIIVVIALAAQALLLNSRPVLPKKIQKFNLN